MKALIFAAGLGTRLKPFTREHPKALVPIGGAPMLERVIEKLKNAGITEMVVNVHHFSSQIVDFLRANNNFGVNIHISDESALLLDTGGGILKARQWLDDAPFLVHNADILTDFPTEEMIQQHLSGKADITLLTASRSTSRYLLFDKNARMQGWENIKTGEVKPAGLSASNLEPLAFGGVHIMSLSVFPALEDYRQREGSEVFSIMPFYIDACRNLDIRSYQPSRPYKWFDVGNPEKLAQAEASLSK